MPSQRRITNEINRIENEIKDLKSIINEIQMLIKEQMKHNKKNFKCLECNKLLQLEKDFIHVNEEMY